MLLCLLLPLSLVSSFSSAHAPFFQQVSRSSVPLSVGSRQSSLSPPGLDVQKGKFRNQAQMRRVHLTVHPLTLVLLLLLQIATMNDEQKLEDLRKRLDRENEILTATRNIRKIQESEAARATSDITIEETQQRIAYFQSEINKLLSRASENSSGQRDASTNSGGSGQSSLPPDDRRPSTHSLHASSTASHDSESTMINRPLSTVGKYRLVPQIGLCCRLLVFRRHFLWALARTFER